MSAFRSEVEWSVGQRRERTILPADGDGAIGVSKVSGEGHAGEDSDLEYTSKPARKTPSQRDEAEGGKRGVFGEALAEAKRAYILMRWRSSAGSRMYDSVKTASMTKFL